jgi:hypothetical protein
VTYITGSPLLPEICSVEGEERLFEAKRHRAEGMIKVREIIAGVFAAMAWLNLTSILTLMAVFVAVSPA